MLKKRRFCIAAALLLLCILLAALLFGMGRRTDAAPGANGTSFVCGKAAADAENIL